MKLLSRLLAILAIAMLGALTLSESGVAQTYPYQTPTYTPTATLDAQTFTATGYYYFTTSGIGSATVRFSGLSGTLSAVVQGTNATYDVTNANADWTTLQMIPVGGGAVATTVTGNGFFFVNTAGMTRFRVNIGTLTSGSHTVIISAAGTASPNATYVMNPQAISGPVGVIGADGSSTLACIAAGSCDVNLTHVAGAAVSQGHGTAATAIRVELPTDGTGTVGLIAGTAVIGHVINDAGTAHVGAVAVDPYPAGATPLTASSADVAASAAVATLAGTSGKTTYITGFQCTGSGATAAATVDVTVSGTITGSMIYIYNVVAGATLANSDRVFVSLPYPVPASAANTAIVVTMPSLGTGNLHAACAAQGFQL